MEDDREDEDWFEQLTGIPLRFEWWQIIAVAALAILYAMFCP